MMIDMAFELKIGNSDRPALIDEEDIVKISGQSWSIDSDGYVIRNYHGKKKAEKIHRVILGITDPNIKTDHRDGDKLNNQKYNLRICSPQQNSFNRKKPIFNRLLHSKYKGVTKPGLKTWETRIKHNGKSIFLGAFKSEEEAALAYDFEAVRLFGEFASTNLGDSYLTSPKPDRLRKRTGRPPKE